MTVTVRDLIKQLSSLPPTTVPIIMDSIGLPCNVRVMTTDTPVGNISPDRIVILMPGATVRMTESAPAHAPKVRRRATAA